jgi:hypothetical protein
VTDVQSGVAVDIGIADAGRIEIAESLSRLLADT